MTTFYAVLFLVFCVIIASFAQMIVLNVAGLPGVLVAGKPGNRSKARFQFGSVISSLGQTYINLAYVAFIVSWSMFKIDTENVNKFIIWVFAFLAVVFPIYKTLIIAQVEDKERGGYANPQVEALLYTLFFTCIGFFFFVFMPQSMDTLWSWVPYVR